jgi:Winged helix DNA-binding domain
VPIPAQRLHNQLISRPRGRDPARVVAWLGAVQAQEYGPAKWALGLRMSPAVTDRVLDRAIDRGSILRTHVLRPTWHFVTPGDIRWLLDLTAPLIHRRMENYDRQLGLQRDVMTRAVGILERAIGDHGCLTRRELGVHLQRTGLPSRSMELGHIAMYAELEGLICSGPRRGTQSTYALLTDRAPAARRLQRDEALAELTRRYFRSHGPATIRDFVWWSGLRNADAKRGLEMTRLRPRDVDGLRYWTFGRKSAAASHPKTAVHLLPIYDEYLVAYRDRQAVPHSLYSSPTIVSVRHALVIDGQMAGTWRPILDSKRTAVELAVSKSLTSGQERSLARAVVRYRGFLGVPVKPARRRKG